MSVQMRDQTPLHSAPPCAEGSGVAVNRRLGVCGLPASLTLPRNGGGSEPAVRL
jgi:hypothetical protein